MDEFTCSLRLYVNSMFALKIKFNALPLKPTCCKRHNFEFKGKHYLFLLSPFALFEQFLYHLVGSWKVFADRSASIMRTIGNYGNLLATKAMTRSLSVKPISPSDYQQPLKTSCQLPTGDYQVLQGEVEGVTNQC